MAEPALAYLPDPAPCAALDAILAEDEHTLPETDGLPLADGRIQQGPLTYSRDALRFHLRHRNDHVAVEGDMFIYYVGRDDNGGPTLASVSPDIFVVYGVPDRPDRNSYVLWNEPDADIRFVLEIASPSTRRRDHTVKREVYASLGVAEYFLYDPPTRRRDARILGLRLRAGEYEDMPYEELPNGSSGVRSDSTGLVAYVDVEGELKWFDPASGQDLRSYDEVQHQVKEVEIELDAAKAQIADLEAQIQRLSGEV
ncbi:MAG: Uma2 family endonuclease [Gammaproteobacteria bacterium]|nr:Uma2 family endonuclease [Gammaproteobacteria bacterium]MDE0440501.1 Uma2 family endonuclease [Gammaproteobacteria bacterium]